MKHTGACWTTIFLMIRSSSSKLFASALDSAFFKRRVMNLTDFSGQRPVVMMLDLSSSYDLLPSTKVTLGRLELFGLASTTNATRITTEGNDLFVLHDIAEVSVCLGQFQACQIRLVSVDNARLIMNAPERAAATSRMFLKCVRRYSPRARAAVSMRNDKVRSIR